MEFTPVLDWIDVPDPASPPTGARKITAADLLRYENGLTAAATEVNNLADTATPILKVETFGAAGDGATDDQPAFVAANASAFTRTIVLERGKTYRIGSNVTVSKDIDLNGAIIDQIGGVFTFNGKRLANGRINVQQYVRVLGTNDVEITRLQVYNQTAGSNGLTVEGCVGVQINYCVVNGGFRGILLLDCDNFWVERNLVSNVSASAAYGILVQNHTAAAPHGNGWIEKNLVVDCWFGICGHGGEANPAQPGYTGEFLVRGLTVRGNVVQNNSPTTLIGCIWFTNAEHLLVTGNQVHGGWDIGIDFEHCRSSKASVNIVTNILLGGLSALFQSEDILFTGNYVEYSRTQAAMTVTGHTWANTSNMGLLNRDDPKNVVYEGNQFVCKNGTLMQLDLGHSSTSEGVTFRDNQLMNAYVVQGSPNGGLYKQLTINNNKFRYSINLNAPAIYTERPNGLHIDDNEIWILATDSWTGNLNRYITVYDNSTTQMMDNIWVQRNIIHGDPAAGANNGGGIAISSLNPALKGTIADNQCNKISGLWAAGGYTALVLKGNKSLATPGRSLPMTAHDNATLLLTYVKTDPETIKRGSHTFGAAIVAGTGTTQAVTFATPFESTPTVTCIANSGRITCAVTAVSATGFTIGVNNWSPADGTAPTIYWIAVGT